MEAKQVNMRKPRKRKEFPLHFPRIGNLVEPQNLWFEWSPPKTSKKDIWYRLLVYRLRPGQSLAQAAKGKPVYKVEKLTNAYHQYPGQSLKLDAELPYCWRVEARDGANRLIGRSVIQAFRFLPQRTYRSLDLAWSPALFSDLSDFLPVPPIIWGCPVRLRALSSLPDEELLFPEEPGEVDPLAFTLWGSEAARLYLVPSLVRHANICWDYSHIDGCSQVLFQTAGVQGFEIPNATDARADDRVRASYLGPVTVDPEVLDYFEPNLEFLGSLSGNYYSYDLNLQNSEYLTPISEFLYVRLAPLDAAGNQIAPASDHVSIHCVDYPHIELESCEAEWFWGENPRRRIHFTVVLRDRFPSTLVCGTVNDAPATLIITGGAFSNVTERGFVRIENDSLTEEDGTLVTTLGTWFGNQSYFKLIDRWSEGTSLRFTLEQSSIHELAVLSLLDFTDLRLLVRCIPGLRYNWQIYTGTMLEGNQPPIGSRGEEPCSRPLLSHQWEESGLEPIYRLFTQPLTGRRVSSRDGEQDVQVRFEFPVEIPDTQAFRAFLQTGGWFTMVETIAGDTRSYDFAFGGGFHATMYLPDSWERYGGDSNIDPGHLIFDPPRLEMHFRCDRSYWDDAEARFVEDIETVDYYLSIE